MNSNKLAIVGTAGIPAKYGGFETLAEFLTKHLGSRLNLTVYCSSKNYTQKKKEYNHAKLKYIPIGANGVHSILYDIVSLFNAAPKNDTILILGVSGCIILPFFRLFYPNKKLIINIDGLEHKRDKWEKPIQRFLKYSEKLAVKYGDVIIADNKAIQEYIKKEYDKESELIAYGGDHAVKNNLSHQIKEKYKLPANYAFKVCRIEPENNIQLILEAFSTTYFPLVIIGNWMQSQYGQKLKNQFSGFNNLFLLDSIYDQDELNQIRSNCNIYIHGHSAGGTNPSLVEAMALGLPVIAFDVEYNRQTTFNQALYFKNSGELKKLVQGQKATELEEVGKKMKQIAEREYTWEKIAAQYYDVLTS